MEERDSSRWMDFEGAGTKPHSCACCGAAAGCGELRDRRIRSVWDAAGQQACSWGMRRGELERRVAFYAAREVEQAGKARKERGYVGESACASLLRRAQTQYHSPLRIPSAFKRRRIDAAIRDGRVCEFKRDGGISRRVSRRRCRGGRARRRAGSRRRLWLGRMWRGSRRRPFASPGRPSLLCAVAWRLRRTG